MKRISFGRLGMDDASAAKWTHAQPDELASGAHASFLHTELWAPSWNVCEREDAAPDVFFSTWNARTRGRREEHREFESVSILAVASSVETTASDIRIAQDIGEAVNAVLIAQQIRPWGISFGDVGFTDAIQDLYIKGLFVPGPLHDKPLSASILQGEWTALANGKSQHRD